MDTARWQRIDRILDDALERAPEERAAFVAEACGGDEELRREVESLLAAHNLSKDFIEEPALDVAARLYAEGAEGGALAPGQKVGRYVVERLLGRGGMGEVYLARDAALGRQVALKVVSAELTRGTEALRRFAHEARAVLRLNHPNIVTLYDIQQDDGLSIIVSEYIEGETLRERLRAGALPVAEALTIAVQVADALAAAHEAGIIHRDIKPENVMLRRDGFVKVLDFGIAKFTPPAGGAADAEAATQQLFRTATGLVIGTAHYMSPEQARGLPVDARTDVWSLGCVLYEMCAGRPPFGGATSGDVLVAVLDREPPDLAQLAEGVRAELSPVVSKALRKDRDERYASAEEFARELRALRRRLEGDERPPVPQATAATAETVTRVWPVPPPALAPAAGAPSLALVVGLVAASLLVGVGIWFAMGPAGGGGRLGREAPVPERTLAYSMTVQKYRGGRPFEEPFELGREILFEKDYRVRLNVRGRHDGHLYILNERPAAPDDGPDEGRDAERVPSYIVLFPSPTANGGSSRVTAEQRVQIPERSWFRFDGEKGTETVWLVWSPDELPHLEALRRYANPDDRGIVPAQAAGWVRDFLKFHAASPPEVFGDEERRETVVRARGGVVAHALKLQHH